MIGSSVAPVVEIGDNDVDVSCEAEPIAVGFPPTAAQTYC